MKNITQKLVTLTFSILLVGGLMAQTNNIAVNPSAAAPDASAILDVNSDAATAPKGFLVPRMTRAQRIAISAGTPTNGMTVYQTNTFGAELKGFYAYRAGTGWVYMVSGDDAWQLTGNTGTVPITNYLGTTDNQPVIFRTQNLIRGGITTAGNFDVGSNPTADSGEKMQIDGAIKMTGTSATNDAGVIRWNAGNNRHEGNVDGTATGWKDLENPYNEVYNAAYVEASPVTCAAGNVDLGPALINSSNGNVTPILAAQQRKRSQYIFRRDELDLSLNQLNNPTATQGLCANQPINSIAINITGGITANFTALMKITIKHTSFSAFGAAFDNTPDPAQQCACYGPLGCNAGPVLTIPAGFTGWQTFPLQAPFIWNGIDNVLIDICYSRSVGNGIAAVSATNNLGFNASISRWGGAATGDCGATGAPGCGSTFPIGGCGMTAAGCTSGNTTNIRPVFRFNGTVGTAAPATSNNGDYVQYPGGLVVEENIGYALGLLPLPVFEGPGTIKAENGVYSNLSQLNDHVFDLYFDGRVSSDEVNAFGHRRHMDVDEMVNYVEDNRHLPTMKGRKDWIRQGGFALDDLTNQLWMTTETQALYLTELNEQVEVLEMLSTDRPLNEDEFASLKQSICSMKELTDGKKEKLIEQCRTRVSPSTQNH